MKRKILFFLFVILLIGLVIGGVKFISGRSGKMGELRVDSQPTVSVFLNDKHIGRAAYRDKVASGDYTIKLVPEGTADAASSWQGKITVGPNLLTYVNATLSNSELTSAVDILWLEKITSKQSEISVTTNPDGATLLIDNEAKGVTPITVSDVAAGDHTIAVTSPGFVSRTLKIKTTGGYRLITTIKLALSGEALATPTQEATPSSTLSATPKPQPKTSATVKPTPTKTATSSGTIKDPDKPFVIIKDTPTGFLRVRKDANTSSDEVGRVNPGEKYHIEDEQSGWYQIKYNGTDEGWISGQYATKTE